MEDKQEQFDSLRKLLALKRHEAPPPRFFDDLPARVMRRIDRPPQSSWESLMDRLFAIRWFRTAAAGAMTLLVGTLLVLAMIQPAGDSVSTTSATLITAPDHLHRDSLSPSNQVRIEPARP